MSALTSLWRRLWSWRARRRAIAQLLASRPCR